MYLKTFSCPASIFFVLCNTTLFNTFIQVQFSLGLSSPFLLPCFGLSPIIFVFVEAWHQTWIQGAVWSLSSDKLNRKVTWSITLKAPVCKNFIVMSTYLFLFLNSTTWLMLFIYVIVSRHCCLFVCLLVFKNY